jgi:hypothetical protein
MNSDDKSIEEEKEVKALSQRKLNANRENAKKSTGPKTSRGKAISRFNAERHGLTAKRLMFAADGKPVDNGLNELIEDLRDRYGRGDAVTELLIENIAVDCWRQGRGLEGEMSYFSRSEWSFYPTGCLPAIQRYNITNRRALMRNLELLEKLHPSPARIPADCSDSGEDDFHAPTGQGTEAGLEEQLSAAARVAQYSQAAPARDLAKLSEPNVTHQVLTSAEGKGGSETEANPERGDTAPARSALPTHSEVRRDDEEVA